MCLANKMLLKCFTKLQILLVNGRQLIFTNNRCQRPGVTYLGLTGKQLVCHFMMIFSRIAFTDTILHQS